MFLSQVQIGSYRVGSIRVGSFRVRVYSVWFFLGKKNLDPKDICKFSVRFWVGFSVPRPILDIRLVIIFFTKNIYTIMRPLFYLSHGFCDLLSFGKEQLAEPISTIS